jgi:hypothetical protein
METNSCSNIIQNEAIQMTPGNKKSPEAVRELE